MKKIILLLFLISINIFGNNSLVNIKNTTILYPLVDTNKINFNINGKFQLIKTDGNILILLFNGTEIKKIDKKKSIKFIDSNKKLFYKSNNIDNKIFLINPKNYNFKNIINLNSIDKILHLGKWQTNTNLYINTSLGSSNISIGGWDFGISHTQKISLFYLGASYKYKQFLGSLPDTVNQINDKITGNNILGLSFAIPFFKYEINWIHNSIPQYYWLQDSTLDHFYDKSEGDLIRDLNDTLMLDYSSNIEHTLKFKIGYITYQIIIDNDTYKTPIYIYALENLPALFGTWGMGLIQGPKLVYPVLWANFSNILNKKININKKINMQAKLSPFNFFLAYKSKTNFSLSVGANLKFIWGKNNEN